MYLREKHNALALYNTIIFLNLKINIRLVEH